MLCIVGIPWCSGQNLSRHPTGFCFGFLGVFAFCFTFSFLHVGSAFNFGNTYQKAIRFEERKAVRISRCFLKSLMALLRYNECTMRFPPFKSKIQWFLNAVIKWNKHTSINSKTFFITTQVKSVPLCCLPESSSSLQVSSNQCCAFSLLWYAYILQEYGGYAFPCDWLCYLGRCWRNHPPYLTFQTFLLMTSIQLYR